MNQLISIIVPVYNIKKYLRPCFKSLVGQTYQDVEIIFVDDGSTDGSNEICDELVHQDYRVKVFHKKNGGLSSARNFGIQHAKGDYIIFVDGDDTIASTFVEQLASSIQSSQSNIAVCGFDSIPSGPKEIPREGIITGKQATIELLTQQRNYQIVSWNKIYDKKLFDNIKFPVGKIHEDTLTTYKLLHAATKVSFISAPLYHYRQRANSIMDTVKLENRLEVKLSAALEAKQYLAGDKQLTDAAAISELLAYFSFLDNAIIGNIDTKHKKRAIDFLYQNKSRLLANSLITTKLKTYIIMATTFSSLPYVVFRKIKH